MGAFLSYFWSKEIDKTTVKDIESQNYVEMDYPYIMDNGTPTFDFENPTPCKSNTPKINNTNEPYI